MSSNMQIGIGDFENPQVLDLLRAHLQSMHDITPIESAYALDASELQASNITFWTACDNETVMGCAALKELSASHGEIKSMRTHSDHLRKGVAAALLSHMIDVAKSRGYNRLSLETGTIADYEPALALYRKFGFENGEIFADYKPSPHNQFLHKAL